MEEDEISLRRERGTAKAKFTRKVNLFHEHMKKGDPPDVLESVYDEIVESVYDEIVEQFRLE